MELFQLIIAFATLLCALVAGFLLAFTIVVMPGIQNLSDHDFLKAFKVIDRVIQNNQPVFMFVWGGSVLVLIISAWMSFSRLEGAELALIIGATAIYLIGVQLPTAIINVPLNNQLQAQNLESHSEAELKEARQKFEPRWIRWNSIRTGVAMLASVMLIILITRL